jgi:cell division septum initiation protein DivIVA
VVVTPDELVREAEDSIELWFCELDHAHADLIADAETIAEQVIAEAEAQARSLTAAARAESEDIVGAAHVEARRVLEEAVSVAERLRNEAIADVAHLRRVVATLENELTLEAAEHGIATPSVDALVDLVDHVAVDELTIDLPAIEDEQSSEDDATSAPPDEHTAADQTKGGAEAGDDAPLRPSDGPAEANDHVEDGAGDIEVEADAVVDVEPEGDPAHGVEVVVDLVANEARVITVDLVAAEAASPAAVTAGNGDRDGSDVHQPAKRRRGLRRLFSRSHV